MKFYAFLLLLCGGALAARAQSTAFTYQGRLAESGAPFSGLADMQFTLFSAPTGGVALAASGIVSVNVTDGLFTVPLNFGAAAFPGADRFLQIATRTNSSPFTVLSPRQLLTATPYAMPAANLSGATSYR